MNGVEGFRGEFRFLSNFWPARVRVSGVVYPTVEHAFVACKTLDLEARLRVAACTSPGEAKRLGRTVALRPGWDGMRLEVMRELLRVKFRRGSVLAGRLLATGDAELVEVNEWNDRFWGVCRGVGENHLGRLLMEVRAGLAAG